MDVYFTTESLRVMIVDDERSVADMLATLFRHAGYECLVSYSGEDAIACTRDYAPDLLICDLNMPGMGGQACAEWVSSQLPACRILLLTGDYLALAKARGALHAKGREQAFLIKPQPPIALLREAHRLLQHGKKKVCSDLTTTESHSAVGFDAR